MGIQVLEDLFNRDDVDFDNLEQGLSSDDRLAIIKARQREKLSNDVMRLYYQGKTYTEIEAELGITYAQVGYVISKEKRKLRDETQQTLLARRNESINHLLYCIRELSAAWEKSKLQDRKVFIKRATMRNVNQANPNAQPNVQEIEEQVEESPGNIDYMKAIMWCRAKIAELDGQYAPKKISQEVSGEVQVTSARDALLQKLSLMGDRNNIYDERKQLEAIDAEIIEKEVPQNEGKVLQSLKFPQEFAADFKVPKPTKLLNAIDEGEF